MVKKFLIVLFILALSVMGHSETTELVEISPYVHGLWKCIGYSNDKGTTKNDGGGKTYCRVSGSAVVMVDGTRLSVKKVIITEESGTEYVCIGFYETTNLWVISVTGNKIIMVQVLDGSDGEETSRYLFAVVP